MCNRYMDSMGTRDRDIGVGSSRGGEHNWAVTLIDVNRLDMHGKRLVEDSGLGRS